MNGIVDLMISDVADHAGNVPSSLAQQQADVIK